MDFAEFLYAECEMREKQLRKKIPMSVIEDIKTEIANYTLSDDEKTDMDEDSIKWGIKIAYDIIDKHTKGDTE